MDPKTLFKKTLEQATATFKTVDKRHFKNPTPCDDWDCRTLLNHILYELAWVPDILDGKTIKEVGKKYDGDLLGKDHVAKWLEAAYHASSSVDQVNLDQTVHLSYGDVPARVYIKEISNDLLIHSWDADQSFQCTLVFQPDLAQAVYDNIFPNIKAYTASGLFGKPVKVPEDSRLQTKLLAIVGRREPVVS